MRHSKKHSRRRKARSRGDQQSQQLEPRLLLTSVLGDFNGDGYNDLATGIPHEDVGRLADAGTVLVRYGTGYGLTGLTETWNGRNIDGLSVATDDQFGASLTVGDFDGNGVDDLAIGVPNRDVSGIRDAGAVAVVYGYRHGMFGAGLSPYRTQTFFQGVDGLADKPEMLDRFGTTLAAGDFTGDGNDELVVGVPSESFVTAEQPDFVTFEDAGAVHVINGSSRGLHTANDQFWTRRLVDGMMGRYDRFGSSFAVGDFDGSGHDDLAIGAPGETIGGQQSAGGVHVLNSLASGIGLSRWSNQWFHQDSREFWYTAVDGTDRFREVEDSAEAFDLFGSSLAAADFNGDGRDDLAIGVPGEDFATGAVNTLLTSRDRRTRGLSLIGNKMIREWDLGVRGSLNDLFGYTLAVRNDGPTNHLLVGIPGYRFNAGAVGVVTNLTDFRSLSSSGGRMLFNRTPGDHTNDFWGSSITVGQINSRSDR
ncbi:MAG: FG-GAP repeat protein, partial [Planctomycetaceae bacterium]